MFDSSGDEPCGGSAPTGAVLAASLAPLAEVTAALAGVAFAELAEPVVKDTLVALDGCR